MLPDFPELKKAFEEGIIKYYHLKLRNHPLFRGIKYEHLNEGSHALYQNQNRNYSVEIKPDEISEGFSATRDEIIDKGPKLFIEMVDSFHQTSVKEMARRMYASAAEAIEKVGNVVDCKGKPLTKEHLLALLEKVEIDFTPDGDPIMPTLHLSPKFRSLIQEWETDKNFAEKIDLLIEQKREDWNARESNRKLVD